MHYHLISSSAAVSQLNPIHKKKSKVFFLKVKDTKVPAVYDTNILNSIWSMPSVNVGAKLLCLLRVTFENWYWFWNLKIQSLIVNSIPEILFYTAKVTRGFNTKHHYNYNLKVLQLKFLFPQCISLFCNGNRLYNNLVESESVFHLRTR